MSGIDWSKVVTAEAKAAEKAKEEAKQARREQLLNVVKSPPGVVTLASLNERMTALEELLGYRESLASKEEN